MAWKWVSKIKNGINEYNFVVPLFPISSYSMGNSSYDQISNSAYRSNAEQFTLVSAMVDDANAQKTSDPTIYNSNTDGSIDKFVYGDSGGTALRIVNTRSVSGSNESNSFKPFRYLSFSSNNQIANATLNLDITAKSEGNFCGVALVMNEDLQQIYMATVDGQNYYKYDDHTPNSQDYVYFRIRIYHNSRTTTDESNLWDIFKNSIPSGGNDPYADGGYSTGTDTGTGDFDDTSDPVALPTLPSVSALSSGLISLYKVSQTEVSKFVGFLWSDSFSVASLSKIFSDPMQAIISFGMFPFDVSAGASVPIYLGKNNTGAVGDLVTAQYVTVPMGSVNLTEFYGGALDYNPYTKIQLVLPYCGVLNINPDEFMTKAVTVTYRVDILSGACVAFVSDGERVLQQVNGNCLVTLPYASTDFKQVYSSLLGLAGTAGAAIVAGATGGLTAPVVGGIGASLAMNTLNAKENYARGGAAGSTLGFLGVQTPYLVITRPRQCLPENNGHFQGYPLYTTERLGDLTGFTKVAQIHLDDIDATDSELKEIARLLTEGVIL